METNTWSWHSSRSYLYKSTRTQPGTSAEDEQTRLDRALSSASVRPAKEMAQEISPPDTSTLEFILTPRATMVVVKIIDSTTRELVRQIPMEEMLALAKALGRLKGLLLNTKV